MRDFGEYETMAKLNLPKDERELLTERAKTLTDSFAALEGIDTADTEPLVTVLNVQNVLREDISRKMLTRDELLSNAPEQYDGYFQVPKTLD